MKLHYVSRIEEVLEVALLDPPQRDAAYNPNGCPTG